MGLPLPYKVKYEITPKGWVIVVETETGEVLAKREHDMVRRGHSRAKQPGEIGDDLGEAFDTLSEEINENNAFDVCIELIAIQEDMK